MKRGNIISKNYTVDSTPHQQKKQGVNKQRLNSILSSTHNDEEVGQPQQPSHQSVARNPSVLNSSMVGG